MRGSSTISLHLQLCDEKELHFIFANLSRRHPNAFDSAVCERLGTLFAVFVRERTQSGGYWVVALTGCWWQTSTE